MARPISYDREAAIQRAVDTFWKHGFSATSVRLLVKDTGVGTKGLYAEFGSKDGLFIEAIERYIADNEAYYRSRLDVPNAGLEHVVAHFESYRFDDDFQGCLLVNSLGERKEIPAEAAAHIDAFFDRIRGLFRTNLEAAQRAGSLRQELDVEGTAAALVAFDQGLAVAGKSPSLARRLKAAIGAFLEALTPNKTRDPRRDTVR